MAMLFIMLYKVFDEFLKTDRLNESKLLSSTFLLYCLLCCTRWCSLFSDPLEENLRCDHLSESYITAVLSCGPVCHSVQGGRLSSSIPGTAI